MHIAIRLGDRPLRLFGDVRDEVGSVIGDYVLGGIRDTAVCKAVDQNVGSVGAMLRPGVADLLSRTPAGALAHRHTCLEDLWKRSDLEELRNRLETSPIRAHQLDILEDFLLRRLPRIRGVHPLIAHALSRLNEGVAVTDIVGESGFSHRYFASRFVENVGLSPKAYHRLGRFNRALDHLHGASTTSLAEVAAAKGYADQPHLTREFRSFTGLTPDQYRSIAPLQARHVPIPG